MELLTAALVAFVAIVPVELPDKTFVATLVLSTRYRPLPVYLGVLAAFGVQCLIAVLAGTLVSQLPRQPVAFVAAALFAIGAVVLVRGARKGEEISEERAQDEYAGKITDERPGWRAALTSFLILFTAEWGDLSQLLTAGLVASGRPAVPVFFGSWAGLALVSGLAILLGRWLLKRVKLSLVRYVGATVCLILAIITVIEAVTA